MKRAMRMRGMGYLIWTSPNDTIQYNTRHATISGACQTLDAHKIVFLKIRGGICSCHFWFWTESEVYSHLRSGTRHICSRAITWDIIRMCNDINYIVIYCIIGSYTVSFHAFFPNSGPPDLINLRSGGGWNGTRAWPCWPRKNAYGSLKWWGQCPHHFAI